MLDSIKEKIRRLKYEYLGLIELNKREKIRYKEEKRRKQKEKVLWQGRYQFKKLEESESYRLKDLYLKEEGMYLNRFQAQRYAIKIDKVYRDMLRRRSYIYACFDMKKQRKLVAVITVNKCLDTYPNYADNPYVHLETFIVHKDYQNQGIGTQLLTRVLEVIKEERCTYAIMQSANPAVQHMAKKVGLTDSLPDMRIDFIESAEIDTKGE